jgi:hypothetical protein
MLEVVFVPIACAPTVTQPLIGGIAVWTGIKMFPEEEWGESSDQCQLACLAIYTGCMAVAAFGDGGDLGALGGGFVGGFVAGGEGFSGCGGFVFVTVGLVF